MNVLDVMERQEKRIKELEKENVRLEKLNMEVDTEASNRQIKIYGQDTKLKAYEELIKDMAEFLIEMDSFYRKGRQELLLKRAEDIKG